LDVFFDHISVSDLRNGVSAINGLDLLVVVLMTEGGQESNRMQRDIGSLSDNDDLLKV
tara:strand:- start:1122 stop:1295 length:174 start_codon:yes stop_codon:yes gene_type:complete